MTQEVKLRRVQCNFKAENGRFLLECDFSKQYSDYYQKRLEKTRPFLEFNCRSKWEPNLPFYGLTELAACYDMDSEQIMSPQSDSSSIEEVNSSFEFSKRMRRLSEGSLSKQNLGSPIMRSSTQVDPSNADSAIGLENISNISYISNISNGQIFSPTSSSPRLLPSSPRTEISSRFNVHSNRDCIVVGTIFKRMKLQPDVIEELSAGDFHVKCERYLGHYTSPDDTLILEDANESINLVGKINPKKFVTGIVVALLGFPIDGGSQFLVKDICYAEPNKLILYDADIASQASSKSSQSSQGLFHQSSIERPIKSTEPIYLMVISSLGFRPDMKKKSNLTKALQNLIDFIWGGEKFKDDARSSRVARILVAGDNLCESRLIEEESSSQEEDIAVWMRKSRQVKEHQGSVQAIRHMDDFFAQLSKTINVDVMPGPSDPSSHLLPQQPFHPCMFPKSCAFTTFNCVTNPYRAIFNDNVDILATSGQNVDIISKFSGMYDPIEIMKCHLKWGSSAPSAPDNLYSVPLEDDDPFVIDFIPEIYIAGCQESYKVGYYYYTTTNPSSGPEPAEASTKAGPSGVVASSSQDSPGDSTNLVNRAKDNEITPNLSKKSRTLLLTVPRFSESFNCVLINLLNLESHLLSFK